MQRQTPSVLSPLLALGLSERRSGSSTNGGTWWHWLVAGFLALALAPAVKAQGVDPNLPPVECSIQVPDGYDDRSLTVTNLWPGGVVPYDFSTNVTTAQAQAMRESMDILQAAANVRFVPRTNQTNFIRIQNSTGNNSPVGMTGGQQTVNIFNWNFTFIMCHELMHTLGVWHEQQRADRGNYVVINYGNLQAGFAHNYDIPANSTPRGSYDFESVMHYTACGFSKCCPAGTNCDCAASCAPIQALPQYAAFQSTMGQRSRLSAGDRAGLAALYGCPTPSIATQPVSQTLDQGQTLFLNSTPVPGFAAGAGGTFQWRRNGVPITNGQAGAAPGGGNVSSASGTVGTTGSGLVFMTISGTTTRDAGSYTVTFTNHCGQSVTSAASVVTVNGPPVILTEPAASLVCAQDTATFSIVAQGVSLSYRWQRDQVNISNGTGIAGATTAALTLSGPGLVPGVYRCVVTNPLGSVTSRGVTLSLSAPTLILNQPVDVTACEGSGATFSIAASGTAPITYQWTKDGIAMQGQTQAALTITGLTAADAGTYFCSVTAGCGTVDSQAALLTVLPINPITANPVDATVCIGAPHVFSVSARGDGLAYQWRRNGIDIPGANASTYPIAATSPADAGPYSCRVTSNCGTATSAAAELRLDSPVTFTLQPSSSFACAGSAVTFQAAVAGAAAPAYQWRKDGMAISGATGRTYSIPSVTAAHAGVYSVAVTVACGTFLSQNAVLDVGTIPTFAVQPSPVAAGEGSSVTLFALGSGTGSLLYQWYKDGIAIAGANDRLYTINSVSEAMHAGVYRAEVINACGTAQSDAARIDVLTCTPQWLSGPGIPGVQGTVHAMVVWDPDGTSGPIPAGIAVGGEFLLAGSAKANNVAFWDGAGWRLIGTGTDGPVYALTTLANGQLVAGGSFSLAGGASASNIARFDGQSWASLSSGVNAPVRALARTPGGDLIVGGDFTSAGGAAASRIARWNGSAWLTMAAGMNDSVLAIGVQPSGTIIAGGRFTTANGNTISRVARWSGTNWVALGSGLDGTVRSLRVATGTIIAGGDFTASGSTSTPFVARWTGSAWAPYGQGPGGSAYSLTGLANGDLVAGGSFVGTDYVGLARWNGSAWISLDQLSIFEPAMAHRVLALAVSASGELFAGGKFTGTFSPRAVQCSSVLRWLASDVSALAEGPDGRINAAAMADDGSVIVGGAFSSAGGQLTRSVARRSAESWSVIGAGFNGEVRSLLSSSGGQIVAGGAFTASGTTSAAGIARWTGTQWLPMGSGANGAVHALARLADGRIVAGGQFASSGSTAASNIMIWNGSAWGPLGAGVNGPVNALLALPSGDIIAAGAFTTAGGVPASGVARWNGTQWMAMGAGVADGSAFALALLSDNSIVVGGEFLRSGAIQTIHVARWNGTSWQPMGTGFGVPDLPFTPTAVYALAALPGGECLAGGYFRSAGGRAAASIARWTGSQWLSIGQGVTSYGYIAEFGAYGSVAGQVRALLVRPDGDYIAAGLFNTAGGRPASNLARWATSNAVRTAINPVGQAFTPGQTVQWTSSPLAAYVQQPGSVSYQWRRNGVPVLNGPSGASSGGGTVSGASGIINPLSSGQITLTIQNIAASDAGTFDVLYTNACASVASDAAPGDVSQSPVILRQPDSVAACEASSAEFSIGCTGSLLRYQWRRDAVNLVDDPGSIGGATTDRLSLTGAAVMAGAYDCVVTNELGTTTSQTASLLIQPATRIVVPPLGTAVCEQNSFLLTLAITGSGPFGYQWYKDGQPIANANGSSYAVEQASINDAGEYRCEVTGLCGSALSQNAVVQVLRATAVSSPANLSACPGSSATFHVEAWGDSLGYEWQRNGAAIPGAVGPTLSLAAVGPADAGSYRCIVTGTCGTATSSAAELAISAPTVITLNPTSQHPCESTPFALVVVAQATGDLTYQWRKDGVSIPGAVASSLAVLSASLADTGSYDVIVSGACGSALSEPAIVNVDALPRFASHPQSQSVPLGGSVTLSVTATGSAPITYQWFRNAAPIAGAVSSELTITPAAQADGGIYSCFASNSCGGTMSQEALLTVVSCDGRWLGGQAFAPQDIGVFSMTRWDPDGAGPATEVVIVGGLFTTIDGVAASNIAMWDGDQWTPLGAGVNSGVSAMAVLPDGRLAVAGYFTQAGDSPANHVATWDGQDWSPVGQGVDGGVNALAATSDGRLIAGGVFTSAQSIPARRVAEWNGSSWNELGGGVDADVAAVTVLTNGDIVIGGNFLNAGGTPVNRIARWDGLTWSPLATGMNASISALTVLPDGYLIAGGSFTAAGGLPASRVARWNGSAWSALGLGVNNIAFAMTVLTNGDLIVAGAMTSAGGAPAQRVARWNGFAWSSVGTGVDALAFALAPGDDGDFSIGGIFGTAGGSPSRYFAHWLSITSPRIASHPLGGWFDEGSTISLRSAPYRGLAQHAGGLAYAWHRNGTPITDGAGGASPGGGVVHGARGMVDPTGATPIVLDISSAQPADAGIYEIMYSNACGIRWSSPAAISLSTPPVIVEQPQNVAACGTDDVSFTIQVAGPSIAYQWRLDGDVLADAGTSIQGAASPQLLLRDDGRVRGTYDCIVTNHLGSATSDAAELTLCPGDFNCDGGVDGADVAAFFIAWEEGTAASDINADGGVDGADVEFFFTRWEGGC